VGYPWQVQPFTGSGAPPPLPFRSPFRTSEAYSFVTLMAIRQSTCPLVTFTTTGTLAPVRVTPHAFPDGVGWTAGAGTAPAVAGELAEPGAAEQPAARMAAPSSPAAARSFLVT
jgi:hypothetical protein